MKKILMLFILLLGFGSLYSYSVPKYFSDSNKNIAPCPMYNKVITVPKGYVLGVNANQQLDLNNISRGDKYAVVLKTDFIYKGKLIASEGSSIIGTISSLPVINENGKTQILIKFTNLITSDGQNIPISAIFNNNNPKGYVQIDENGVLDLGEDVGITIKQDITYVPVK